MGMTAIQEGYRAAASLARRGGRLALDLLYPPRCVLCGRGGAFLCAACEDGLPRAGGRRCHRCWLPLPDGDCRRCADSPLALDGLRTPYVYRGDARKLVHLLKFRDLSVLAEPMAARMAPLAAELTPAPSGAVPVPLSGRRERLRGYNQARLLARALAKELTLPFVDALRRTGSSPPQSESASADERRANVRDAFAVRRRSAVAGLRLLLVDDVATTGATLDACARALLGAGAASVGAVAFARED
jgi:ComF family protein